MSWSHQRCVNSRCSLEWFIWLENFNYEAFVAIDLCKWGVGLVIGPRHAAIHLLCLHINLSRRGKRRAEASHVTIEAAQGVTNISGLELEVDLKP